MQLGMRCLQFLSVKHVCTHSRPQRPRSFWSAPGIETSGRLQFQVRESRTSGLSAQAQAVFKMADQSRIELFHEALNNGLQSLGFTDIYLKEKQYEVLKELVVNKKDVLAVLPTGYGKSLIYQLLPPVLNFMEPAERSTVIVISPLNALIRDQIVKIREAGLNVCVLKGDRGDDGGDDVSLTGITLEALSRATYDLIFAHPEVVVDSKKVSQLLKSPTFNRKVRAIVVDEAHLVIDW